MNVLTELCAYLRNWFTGNEPRLSGTFTITVDHATEFFGSDVSDYFKAGQYVRIVGSTFNDGVKCWNVDELEPETFDGAIIGMAVPKEVVALAKEIKDWQDKYQDALNSPYQSESFGGYSYTRASGNANTGASVASWHDVFAARLAPWRKI